MKWYIGLKVRDIEYLNFLLLKWVHSQSLTLKWKIKIKLITYVTCLKFNYNFNCQCMKFVPIAKNMTRSIIYEFKFYQHCKHFVNM